MEKIKGLSSRYMMMVMSIIMGRRYFWKVEEICMSVPEKVPRTYIMPRE